MYKKIKVMISAMLTVIVTAMCFAGCSSDLNNADKYNIDPTQKGTLAVLVGKSRNNAQPALDSGVLNNDVIALAQKDGSKIAAIELDGNPFVVYSKQIAVQSGASSSIKKQDANMYVSNMGAAISDSVPLTAEVDILSGLNTAVRELTASDATESNKVLYVLSNGLQTTGILNMAEYNILESDVDLLIKQIKDSIPNMNSIDKVVWVGIADTADSQDAIDESNKNKLKNIWKAIIEEGGSTVEFINDNTVSNDNPDDWPAVSNVTVVNSELNISDVLPAVVRFDQEKISFVSDKAEFIDEVAAYEALEPIAEALKADRSLSILIVGSTATDGTAEGCERLSRQRADKVRTALLELGAYADQMQTYGAGMETTLFRVNDLDDEGNLIESEAEKNRAVYVINADSPIAEQFNQ